MPSSLGPAEILVILVVALIVLGPKRLPEAGRQVGKFVAEIRHWSSTVQAEIRDVIEAESEPQPPPAAAAPPAPVSQPAPPTPSTVAEPPLSGAFPTPEARKSPQSEWGLTPPTPKAPPRPASPLPPEWGTPPSSNGEHA